jgi:hypothetical protein
MANIIRQSVLVTGWGTFHISSSGAATADISFTSLDNAGEILLGQFYTSEIDDLVLALNAARLNTKEY